MRPLPRWIRGRNFYLREAMNTAMQGRATLIIAHRLATVIRLPRIIVLSGGRIVDEGTHEELPSRSSHDRTFVPTQLVLE